jgi:hypothetical protein
MAARHSDIIESVGWIGTGQTTFLLMLPLIVALIPLLMLLLVAIACCHPLLGIGINCTEMIDTQRTDLASLSPPVSVAMATPYQMWPLIHRPFKRGGGGVV